MCYRGAGLMFNGLPEFVAGEPGQCLRVCRMCCRVAGLISEGPAVPCYRGAGLMPLCLPESRLNYAGRMPGTVGDTWESPD